MLETRMLLPKPDPRPRRNIVCANNSDTVDQQAKVDVDNDSEAEEYQEPEKL